MAEAYYPIHLLIKYDPVLEDNPGTWNWDTLLDTTGDGDDVRYLTALEIVEELRDELAETFHVSEGYESECIDNAVDALNLAHHWLQELENIHD